MKSFIKKIAKSNLSISIRNLIGFRPVALNSNKLRQNFSVSDGFPWRTDNNFKTNFKYTDLLKVFYDELNSNVEIHFYDKNNMEKIKISKSSTISSFEKKSFIYNFVASMRQKLNDPLGTRAKKRESISQR